MYNTRSYWPHTYYGRYFGPVGERIPVWPGLPWATVSVAAKPTALPWVVVKPRAAASVEAKTASSAATRDRGVTIDLHRKAGAVAARKAKWAGAVVVSTKVAAVSTESKSGAAIHVETKTAGTPSHKKRGAAVSVREQPTAEVSDGGY